MIDPYICTGTPYRPRLLIIVVYGIFLNEITGNAASLVRRGPERGSGPFRASRVRTPALFSAGQRLFGEVQRSEYRQCLCEKGEAVFGSGFPGKKT